MTGSAVQKLRIRYAKRDRLRFSSHRDFQRAFERALRRAGVPIAYSQGFTPHPKVSYAGAAPTGAASEAEYLEISVAKRCDPATLAERLGMALPAGLDIVEVVEARTGSLADRLTASAWRICLFQVDRAVADRAVEAFLSADQVPVDRLTKSGRRRMDARAAVVRLDVAVAGTDLPYAILDLVVRHATPSVRPDDVLAGLRQVADMVPPVPPLVTRLAQGSLDETSGTVGDPLAPDRDAAQGGSAGAAVLETPADA